MRQVAVLASKACKKWPILLDFVFVYDAVCEQIFEAKTPWFTAFPSLPPPPGLLELLPEAHDERQPLSMNSWCDDP
jgi:hypothetical protein